MSSAGDLMGGAGAAGGRKRGSRKSIAFQPSSSLMRPATEDNKENGGSKAAPSKKSRSKSLGPGELARLAAEHTQEVPKVGLQGSE